MFKTTFRVAKMDCPSEEQMIRVRLDELENIDSLRFDIPGRVLDVYHTGGYDKIFAALESLDLDTSLVSSVPAHDGHNKDDISRESRVLWQVLFINFFFFLLEILTGFLAGSMGLVADSLDMLADSIVYGLSLFAVGGSVSRKKSIAKAAGYFQLGLAVMGLVEVARRFLLREEMPDFYVMIIISVFALAGNAACLYLLQGSRSREAHMQASVIFTSNDVIVNLGVIAAGVLVFLTASRVPDLVVGTVVFVLVTRGAYRILKLSR